MEEAKVARLKELLAGAGLDAEVALEEVSCWLAPICVGVASHLVKQQ